MLVSAIKTGVKRFGFDDSDPLLDWINEAVIQFVDAFDWPWMKTTNQYNFIADGFTFSRNIGSNIPRNVGIVYNGVYTKLIWKPLIEFEEDGDAYCLGSLPKYWTFYGSTDSISNAINFSPIPTVNFTLIVNGQTNPPILTADGDQPIIPPNYHYPLVRGAAAIGLDSDSQEERASVQAQRFQDSIDRAINKYRVTQTGVVDKVRQVYP